MARFFSRLYTLHYITYYGAVRFLSNWLLARWPFRDHDRRSVGDLWAFGGYWVSNICVSIYLWRCHILSVLMFWCQRLWYILHVTCWIATKRGGVLNWPLLSKLQRTAKSNKPKTTDKMKVRFCFEFVFTFILRIYASVSNKRRAGWMCKSSPARFRLQNYYFFWIVQTFWEKKDIRHLPLS